MTRKQQYCAALTVGMGALIGGYASAYTGASTDSMKAYKGKFQITEHDISWIGSLQPLFATFGSILGGVMLEKLGRRWSIILGRIPFIPGFLLIFFACNVTMMMSGRTISGIGVGIETLSSPIYLGEIIDPEIRGTLALAPSILGNLGVLLAYILGAYLSWQWLAFMGMILTLPFFSFVYFLPESPSWMKAKELRKAAAKADDVKPRCASLGRILTAWKKVLDSSNRRSFLISLALQFFQQFTGINAIIYFDVDIFESAGGSIEPHTATMVIGVMNLISTLMATYLVDRIGRRSLLFISSAIMFITLSATGIYFQLLYFNVIDKSYSWVVLLFLIVFVMGFSIGAGPIPWLMMGEILPKEIRGAGAAIVTAFHWLCTFVVTKCFYDIKTSFGYEWAFYLFAFFCFIHMIFMKWVPETKGKSLEEIEVDMTMKPKERARRAEEARANAQSQETNVDRTNGGYNVEANQNVTSIRQI